MEAERRDCNQELAQKIEELVVENSDLKERMRALQKKRAEPDDRSQLQQALAQREAELHASNEALQRLQEVLDDSASSTSVRCVQLERELREARHATAEAQAGRAADAKAVREAHEAAAAAAAHEGELVARCRAAEREAQDSSSALESLLQEKGQRMEEREHLVDRRLVNSMLVLYVDHLESGQRTLAEQVLNQTLQVLGGGASEMADRQRIRSAAAEAERKLAEEPLGDAFLDFLTREAGGDEDGGPVVGHDAAATAR